MTLSTNIKRLGLGSLLLVAARGLYTIVGSVENKIFKGVYYGTASTSEISIGITLTIALALVTLVIFLYGIRLMKDSTERIARVIRDLSGIQTGYKLFLYGILGAFIFGIPLIYLAYAYRANLEDVAGIVLTLGLLTMISGLLILIGLILIGLRTKNLSTIGYDVTGPSYLILIGALLIFLPIISGPLLLLGFLRMGLVLYFVKIPPADVVSRIAEDLKAALEKENAVNLIEFAAKNNYPIRFVLEAAFGLAEKYGYTIVNGVLVKTPIM